MFVCLFVLNSTLLAQTSYRDVVYLKNGSVVRGVIVEQVPGKQLKIETSGGSVLVHQMDEVMKTGKEKLAQEGSEDRPKSPSALKKGYATILELGYQGGDFSRYRADVIFGGYFNPYVFLGLGVGVRKYSGGASLLPIFANIKWNIINNKISPYLSFGLGYATYLNSPSDAVKGGAVANLQLGCNFNVSDTNVMNVSLMSESQTVTVSNVSLTYGSWGLSLGFTF